MGAPANTSLAVIDVNSGEVHAVGTLPADMTALAFAPDRDEITSSFSVRKATLGWTAGLLAAGTAVSASLLLRRRRHRPQSSSREAAAASR
jgi:hypothetical protein